MPSLFSSLLLGAFLLLASPCVWAQNPTQPVVTIIELGSVDCVPCRMMQPVLQKAEEQYPGQVRIVFHDVWTPKGEPYARQYKIKGVPTQIFVNRQGRELARNEGYLDYERLEKVMKSAGVK